MTLTAGTRLGCYEIVAPIGAGGMGEVYRARDTKLGRDVAIKVLASGVAADVERLARFRREAQLLASLNHANIAAIHGLEEADGHPFLVLELVDGEDLGERLRRGAIPIEQALPIARQIAAGLEEAHRQGVVHRDLKPANIKLTRDGRVKVLDFGLAKAYSGDSAQSSAPEQSHSPTLTHAGSGMGVILGTAAYMSPEQARGHAVDKRTDIWAFGCVLYDMLSGRSAFGAKTTTDTLAAVVRAEPDWAALPASTPGPIRTLLRRCLAKDAASRLHDIADARIEIEEALATPAAAPTTGASDQMTRLGPWVLALGFGILAAVATLKGRPPQTRLPVLRFELTDPVQLSFGRGFSVSPDGSQIAFVTFPFQLVQVRRLDKLETTILRGTDRTRDVAFSPDGRSVVFSSAEGYVKRVSIGDGTIDQVAAATQAGVGGLAWEGEDRIVFANLNSGLLEVGARGGAVRELTRLDRAKGETRHFLPSRLPDGRALLFTRVGSGGTDSMAVEAVAIATGERKTLLEHASGGVYSNSGHILFAREGGLWAAPFDAEKLALKGPAVRVLDKLYVAVDGSPKFAVSDSGLLVYALPRFTQLAWVDRDGRVESVLGTPGTYSNPRLSPDRSMLAVDDGGDIWIRDLNRDSYTRMTFEPAPLRFPVWTPDGKRLIFTAGSDLVSMPVDRSGAKQAVATSPELKLAASISPDGRDLAYMAFTQDKGADIYVLSLEGPQEPRPFVATPAYEGGPQFSPDGRFMAYVSDESGQREVYVTPYPGPGARWPVSTGGGTHPLWSADGKELFYKNGDALMSVHITGTPQFAASKPDLLFEGRYTSGINITLRNYDVSADGKRFLMIKDETDPRTGVHVVVNWFEDLKRLAPAEPSR